MSVTFVTGGGRGIGRSIALTFAAPGSLVAIAARTASELDGVAAAIRARGAEALPLTMDIADPASVEAGFGRLRRATEAIDTLVNNAGQGGGRPVDQTDLDSWRRILETNVWGTFLVSRQAIPLLGPGGRIVNVSSVLGRMGVPGYTAYCASKHAVIGFTRALALELVGRGITVNCVCPGWVETEMAVRGMTRGAEAAGTTYEEFRTSALRHVPIQRIIQPDEVAALVKFLTSPDAAAITGQTYNICGGQSMD